MFKMFNVKFIAIFALLAQAPLATAKPAKIEDGIIKGATHYHVYPGSNKTIASFWGYSTKIDPHTWTHFIFLGEVELEEWNKATEAKMNSLIDPKAFLPKIKTAKIWHCIKRGRMVTFYDESGTEVDSFKYQGPINLYSESLSGNASLIKPHSLLNSLKEVTEFKPGIFYVTTKKITY